MDQISYTFGNLPIPGGGYVTGFLYDEADKAGFYLRTDIGGAYRFDRDTEKWIPLNDGVTMDDIRETFPIALATDPENPGRLYIISGIWTPKEDQKKEALLAVSDDYGAHFRYHDLPFRAHGNLNGRGTGERLIVDRTDSNTLYYASQDDGLWKSKDRGASWEKLSALPEDYLTLCGQTPDGKALIVGSAGVSTMRTPTLRGKALYVSYDGGKSFTELPQPLDGEIEGVKRAGLVPQRIAFDAHHVYVTFSVMGRDAYVDEFGYSCDGGSAIGGRVARYKIEEDGTVQDMKEITPAGVTSGLAGLGLSASREGLLLVSTISDPKGDSIYRSFDGGETWEEILHDLDIGRMDFRTSYMKPEYNGGFNLIHWLSDLKIDPFDENTMWFNTGTGVFRTTNLTDPDTVVFSDWCDGLEETVHLNLYAPPYGDVILIDILGDLGGFAFKSLDETPRNSFDDADGNRYITCINADFSDTDTDVVVVTPRGNWRGFTKGGLIKSMDGCETFERLPMPFGLSEKLDESLHLIETPNVNSGWVSMSVDTEHIVWSVAQTGGITLPIDMVVVSHDGGETFERAKFYDGEKQEIVLKDAEYRGAKVFSDRVDPEIFYAFDNHGHIFVSRDCGATFYERVEHFPDFDMAQIDCANKCSVRGECGRQGCFYVSLKEHGLWKMEYDAEADSLFLRKLSGENDVVYNIGLGLGRPEGDFYTEPKAIYMNARIGGVYGFYRTFDDGVTYERLGDDTQMFGDINGIEGDPREFGRFFIASGSRGVLYGLQEGEIL